MEHVMAVVLAAGEGKRMKSRNSKVVHKICGKPLVKWVCDSIYNAGINECVLVVGHRADQVRELMGDSVGYALQSEQLGTGHAVMQAEEYFKDKEGYIFVLCGDAPLISSETLSKTLEFHKKSGNSATVITAVLDDPTGYGRIVRDGAGNVLRIREHKDADEAERAICEINSGMYCFSISKLRESLKLLDNNNSQKEYYLTDTLEILIKKGDRIGAVKVSDPNEILGINDRIQLAEAEGIMRMHIINRLLRSGVTIIDPSSVYIGEEVQIGMDTIVYPGCVIEGCTCIGEDCIIGPGSRIVNSVIGNGAEVNNSVVLDSSVGEGTHIGPFAYIRPGSSIGKDVKIGDFVEIKKSAVGDNTKISHLSYVGDADIGSNVNLGCGVVVVNYDGQKKHRSVVGNNAFIGCNVNLVSPVVVGDGSYIAAGSTITENVPENSLAIARNKQINKEDWVIKKGLKK